MHFDLHPQETDKTLGRDVTAAHVADLLARVRPDYVQYDAKGHHGWLGWPSKVGPSAPGIVRDSLAVWRQETARAGVALYIHFSGVWDTQAIRRRPEWARLDANGKPDDRNTSTRSPYAGQLMIPQLREAATLYDLDGVWVDGDCWSAQPDYSRWMVEAWKQSGRGEPPKTKEEPDWLEWLEFNREQFRSYVRCYAEAVHATHPKLQIASNWLYSTYVPEEPTLPVDFLSGDYLGNASISTARLEARYLAQTGKPWDLMAWGFQQADSNRVGHVHKPAVQLQQEAGVVLAQGGGFQIYYQPSRAGHFEEGHIRVMSEVAAFCRARQPFCQGSKTIPQIGVIYSGRSLYRTAGRLFGGWGRAQDPARGFVDALLACLYSVDVVPDWKLGKLAGAYPLLVLPEWEEPGGELQQQLLEYVEAGGGLLVAGAANARWWAARLGARDLGEAEQPQWYLAGQGPMANIKGTWRELDPGPARVLAERFPALDSTRDGRPAALGAAVGKGQIVLLPGPFGSLYAATHAPALREFLRSLLKPVFTPLVEIEGPPGIDAVLRRHRGDVCVHLLNMANMQVAGDYAAVDFIPPVGPVSLRLQGVKARSVVLQPGAERLR